MDSSISKSSFYKAVEIETYFDSTQFNQHFISNWQFILEILFHTANWQGSSI